MNMKKMFLLNLPYLLFVYPFDKLAQAFRLAPGADLSGKLLSIGDGFTAALSSPWLSFHPTDLLIGIAGAVVLRMAVYLKGKNAKKYRHGIEYGSARWGTAADIAPYMDKDFFQNIPMTQTERITMASRPKQPKYARNKNILVIGGSGSGKTRFFCKPSLLQAHSSYVCTDPKGTLLPEIGAFLERKKYDIPPSALEDETFAALITEEEKYIGYPYVWGGSNPNTSFDSAGFVSWVLTQSGVCNTGRLGAQGLYNISTPVSSANASPGDLIFFVGTYDTPSVSHVGIYVGGGKMLHCGDPIQYADINTSYWQSHFYAFGRPPYN